jgi:hypothetical protein
VNATSIVVDGRTLSASEALMHWVSAPPLWDDFTWRCCVEVDRPARAPDDLRRHCCVGRKQDNSSPQGRGSQVCESVRAAYLGRSESPISDSASGRRAPRRLNATVPSEIIKPRGNWPTPPRTTRLSHHCVWSSSRTHARQPVERALGRSVVLVGVMARGPECCQGRRSRDLPAPSRFGRAEATGPRELASGRCAPGRQESLGPTPLAGSTGRLAS